MFTGIIQAVGRIRDNEEIGDGLRIHVDVCRNSKHCLRA